MASERLIDGAHERSALIGDLLPSRTRLLGVLPARPSVDPAAVNTVELALAELPRKDASLRSHGEDASVAAVQTRTGMLCRGGAPRLDTERFVRT